MPTRTQNSCCGPSLILSLSWKLKQAKRFSCPYVSKLGFYDIVKTVETAEPRVCYASQEPLVLGLGTNRTEPNTVSMDGPAISVTRKAELSLWDYQLTLAHRRPFLSLLALGIF